MSLQTRWHTKINIYSAPEKSYLLILFKCVHPQSSYNVWVLIKGIWTENKDQYRMIIVQFRSFHRDGKFSPWPLHGLRILFTGVLPSDFQISRFGRRQWDHDYSWRDWLGLGFRDLVSPTLAWNWSLPQNQRSLLTTKCHYFVAGGI